MHLQRIKKLNQFIPSDFISVDFRTINKKGVDILDLDFIADLFHSFYIKYLRSKDGENITVELSSKIMRLKYGTYYNYYVDFLIDNGFISLKLKHHTGKRCKTYKLNVRIVKNTTIIPYSNTNRKLIWFYNSDGYKSLQFKNSVYSKGLSKYIVSNLSHITIDFQESLSYLNSIFNLDQKSRKYIRNIHSLNNINDGDIHVTFDRYGRVHSNFTVLKKEIRHNHLFIDGETTHERDITSSQALFFLYLISNQINTGIDRAEIRDLQYDILSGIFYENFVTKDRIRKDVKVHFYKYLFGIKFQRFDGFTERYPTISKFIYNYKSTHGNKDISHRLQQMEGDFVFNIICQKLMDKGVVFFTVHDSIVVKQSDSRILDQIFDDAMTVLKQQIRDNLKKCY